MIVLELTEAEARILEQALTRRAGDMLKELVHTDEHTVHAELRVNYEQLEKLRLRVTELVSPKARSSATDRPLGE